MEERIDIHIQSPDPAERDWEYDGDGNRIYKVEAGYGTKTLYKDEYHIWKDRYGHEWEPVKKEEPYKGVKEPYYVDLP
tara:strand:- start:132 stop:365 length:234 start_codon:yes stop_codon:yes gene_type:complete